VVGEALGLVGEPVGGVGDALVGELVGGVGDPVVGDSVGVVGATLGESVGVVGDVVGIVGPDGASVGVLVGGVGGVGADVARMPVTPGPIEGQLVHAVHEGVGVKVMLNSCVPLSREKTGQSRSYVTWPSDVQTVSYPTLQVE